MHNVADPFENEPLNVACVADANYGAYAGMTLYSVLRANPTNVHLHLFSDGVSKRDTHRIERMARDCGAGASIYDLGPTLNYHAGLKSPAHYSRAAYGRLFMADVLPKDVRSIIYLDCDVICLTELQELWKLRAEIPMVGAVRDVWVDLDGGHKRYIGLSEDAPYYNSGVLVVNVDEWRKRSLSEKMLTYLTSGKTYRYVDQDAINYLLSSEITELPRKWNTLVTAPGGEDIEGVLKQASNLHFCAGLKPWHLGYRLLGGAAGAAFGAVKADSPWRYKLPDFQVKRVKRKIRERFQSQ